MKKLFKVKPVEQVKSFLLKDSKVMFSLLFIFLIASCQKEAMKDGSQVNTEENSDAKAGARVSGVGYYATADECDAASQGATYALKMTGDLEGCLYIFIEKYRCSGDGRYYETGREIFVGTYKGQPGSFKTTYKFAALFEGCKDGAPAGVEIIGLCNHPIVKGSGEGVFAGATGELHFWDNIPAGKFPYRGVIRL